MSVYIKGMEMPKNCIDCAFGWNGWCHRINNRAFVEVDMRRHDCPLIHVPEHGQLIDKATVVDNLVKVLNKRNPPISYPDWNDAVLSVMTAPTIIPADKEGEV